MEFILYFRPVTTNFVRPYIFWEPVIMPHSPISPTYQTALAMLKMLKEQVDQANVDPVGLRVLGRGTLWLASERNVVRNTFDGLLFQSLDMLGLPRFILPVEYVAAAIVAFVHPVNYFTACLWSESHGATTDELALEGDYDRFSARQLFAVVCNIYADNDGVGPGTFTSKVDVKVRDSISPLEEPRLEDDHVSAFE